jgi:hypothetical protein
MPQGPELDTIYYKPATGYQACMVEYGTNVKLCKELLAKGFQVTDILPPDEAESIGYTFVWAKKVDIISEVPTVVL